MTHDDAKDSRGANHVQTPWHANDFERRPIVQGRTEGGKSRISAEMSMRSDGQACFLLLYSHDPKLRLRKGLHSECPKKTEEFVPAPLTRRKSDGNITLVDDVTDGCDGGGNDAERATVLGFVTGRIDQCDVPNCGRGDEPLGATQPASASAPRGATLL